MEEGHFVDRTKENCLEDLVHTLKCGLSNVFVKNVIPIVIVTNNMLSGKFCTFGTLNDNLTV